MDPGIIIPVKGYGGHERLVEMFAKEYRRLGHEVHLLITTGSSVAHCTVHGLGKPGFPPEKIDARKAIFTAWKFLRKHRNRFDLIHNFGRLIYLLPVLNEPVKKIMTYGREISARNIRMIHKLPNRNLIFTGCSHDLISRADVPGRWETVYNAIDFEKYTLQATVPYDAPLIFLGRIEKVKGCHTAIEVAKATNNRLIIAGNISPLTDEKEYFETRLKPLIDGHQIQYVGSVNDIEKNHWLGQCKALLFPIEWNEPFGIVMIEAMACGTPVIAFNKGSVNEVVAEGISGYKISDTHQLMNAVKKIADISRTECRGFAERTFAVKLLAAKYLSLHT